MTAIATITAKGQTTIPRDIRAVLGIKPGDLIAWEVEEGGRVAVRRVGPLDLDYLQAVQDTLGEWQSAEDELAKADQIKISEMLGRLLGSNR